MSKTKMSKNEIEQKIRDLKTKLSCQESDIGDWKIAKCIEYSTLGMESPYDLQELHKQRQVIRDEIGALEEELPSVKMRMKPLLKSRRYSQNYCQKSGGFFPPLRAYKYRKYFPKSFVKSLRSFVKNFERLHRCFFCCSYPLSKPFKTSGNGPDCKRDFSGSPEPVEPGKAGGSLERLLGRISGSGGS